MDTEWDTAALEYFSQEPYSIEFITGKDGRDKMRNKPNDPISWDGFCAGHDVSMSELEGLLSPRVVEICVSKLKSFLMTNGLNGSYAAAPWSLTMKNTVGWAEKSESKQTVVTHEDALKELIRRELSIAAPVVVIDNMEKVV